MSSTNLFGGRSGGNFVSSEAVRKDDSIRLAATARKSNSRMRGGGARGATVPQRAQHALTAKRPGEARETNDDSLSQRHDP
jgi:hypothetical protein